MIFQLILHIGSDLGYGFPNKRRFDLSNWFDLRFDFRATWVAQRVAWSGGGLSLGGLQSVPAGQDGPSPPEEGDLPGDGHSHIPRKPPQTERKTLIERIR